MKKAWAFYRRSTEMQEVSIEDQRKVCQAKAAELDLEIVREFIPSKGYASGLTIDRDETFQEMVRLAGALLHGVQYLLVYDVSRFGRLPPKAKFYWEEHFRRCGIQIVYAAEHFQYDGSLGDELHQFVSHSEAHQYSLRLSTSTTRGCKTHAGLGHSVGGAAPYGYDRLLVEPDGTPVKVLRRGQHKADKLQRVVWTPGDPIKVRTVRKIFKDYDEGAGLKKIAAELNRLGVPSARKGRWAPNTIATILRNPAYKGTRVYYIRDFRIWRRTGNQPKFRDPNEWVMKENAHEPLVDKELFDRVRAKLGPQRWGSGRSYHRPWILTGLVFCAHCGHRYNGYRKTGHAHGKDYEHFYYSCYGYFTKGKSVCRSFYVSREELEDFVIREIKSKLANPRLRNDLRASLKELIRMELGPKPESRQAELKKAIQNTEKQLDNLLEAIKGGAHWERLKDEIGGLDAQKRELTAELEALGQNKDKLDDLNDLVDKLMGYLDRFEELMDKGTVEEKKQVLKSFLHKTVINREERTATHAFYKLPVFPSIEAIPYPKEIAGSFLNGSHRRSSVLTNVNCGGWI